MKKEITYELNLDVDSFVKNNYLDSDSTTEDILGSIHDYLSGQDDCVYYNFSPKEVYNEYIDAIKLAASKNIIDPIKAFDELASRFLISTSISVKYQKYINVIKKHLKQGE